MRYKLYLFLLLTFFHLPLPTTASPNGEIKDHEENLILHHIADSHEWHFATISHKHYTLHLPIILVSKDRGVEIFSSSNFWDQNHHALPYQGYMLNHDKIISINKQHVFYDLSITKNVAAMMVSVAVLLMMMLLAARSYKKNASKAPSGFLVFLEIIICFIRDEIAIPNIGLKKYKTFMSYLLSVFFFIWLNNLMGLLPGWANVTGSISVAFVLALFTFIITVTRANKNYWGHIFNPPGVPKWLTPLLVPIELVGVLTKPFSLIIRLFANITAGHIILLSIISLIFIFQTSFVGLISVPFGVFMFLLKLIVAFLQAYVFTLLSAIYFGTAVETEDH